MADNGSSTAGSDQVSDLSQDASRESGEAVNPTRRSTRQAKITAQASLFSASKAGKKTKNDLNQTLSPAEQLLLRVRANRYKRALNFGSNNSHKRKRTHSDLPVDEPTCFICSEILPKGVAAVNAHIDKCLARNESIASTPNSSSCSRTKQSIKQDEEDELNFDGDEFEEYTWAGQTRIRATSMLEGGFSASGFQVHRKTDKDFDSEDILIDDDDAGAYGSAQYTQDDVRKYVAEPLHGEDEPGTIGSPILYADYQDDDEIEIEIVDIPKELSKFMSTVPADAKLMIEALARHIKSLENDTHKMKCMICREPYKTPVASVNCWHVHCEKCWLTTLGMKKLCPQCQYITSPSDLRRVYL